MNVVWLKRDLRITDHGPLFEASQHGKLLVLYIVEDELVTQPDYGANHHCFIGDSLRQLQTELAKVNIMLHLFRGEVTQILQEIHAVEKISALHSHMEVGNAATYRRDKRVQKWCKTTGVRWKQHQIYEVIRPHHNRDGWAKQWKRGVADHRFAPPQKRPTIDHLQTHHRIVEFPSAADLKLGSPAPKIQRGGCVLAHQTLNSFLTHRGVFYQRNMSSPVTAYQSCSRISPHLAYGTISIREAFQTATKFLHALPRDNWYKERKKSLQSFLSRLHWRGHFMQKLEDEVAIEFRCMHRGFEGIRSDSNNATFLQAWKNGMTGYPMVDACMRALRHTGWLNFRMRAMVVSFACYNLWLDWRVIKDWLACQFTDYEPGIHLCQLQMQSGVTGINTIRLYNPLKQAKEQDLHGTFIREWIPELKDVPTEYIHRPYDVPGLLLLMQPFETNGYPREIVSFEATARRAKEIIYAIKKTTSAKQESKRVLSKHGSRSRS